MAKRTHSKSYPRRSRGRSGSTSIVVSAVLAALAAAWYTWGEDLGLPPLPTGGSSSGSVVAEAPAASDPSGPMAEADPAPAAKPVSTGEAVTGTASVVDADTLDIHAQRIRLVGVDAPESKQKCLDAGGLLFRCGAAAANALSDWINRNPVTCVSEGHDRYNRTLGKCTVRGTSVQDWLVRNGHAVAYRAYSKEFIPAEEAAQTAKVGIWAGEFVMPSEWRKGVRLAVEDAKS
jgi:endonuclease YncB( thermonuclease family)